MLTAVQNKQQAFERIQSHQSALKLFGATRLGSFVRSEQQPESDVDIVVEFAEGKKTFRNFMNMADYLEKVLNRKVDLLTWEGMASFVKNEKLKKK